MHANTGNSRHSIHEKSCAVQEATAVLVFLFSVPQGVQRCTNTPECASVVWCTHVEQT